MVDIYYIKSDGNYRIFYEVMNMIKINQKYLIRANCCCCHDREADW